MSGGEADGAAGLAGADLRAALDVVDAAHRHLLSAGELIVLRRLRALAGPALSLVARLLARRDRLLPTQSIRYAEIDDLDAVIDELHRQGLVMSSADPLPVGALLELHDVPGLKEACAALGLPRGGDRATLTQRLRATGERARPALWRPAVRLRHRGLLRRWCAWYLLDHEGDLSRLVIERLGVTRAPTYTPTGGPGLHPCRRAVASADRARAELTALMAALGELGPALATPLSADELRAAADRARPLLRPPWRLLPTQDRWSAARWARRSLTRVAAVHEKRGEQAEALAIYDLLHANLAARPDERAEHAQRAALCLERLGRPAEGARTCAALLPIAPRAAQLALERTGARLARASRTPWIPCRPLLPIRERRLRLALQPAPAEPGRPRWWLGVDGGASRPALIEEVVAAALTAQGRSVFFAENGPWTTIFALLFREALFAPVWGALPGPLLSAPLDLDSPGFFAARADLLEERLAELEAGAGPALLAAAWERHAGEQLRGASWTAWGLPRLLTLCAGLGGAALAAIMRAYAEDHRGAGRGMPDLVIEPGPAARVPGLFPGGVQSGVQLIEVKGPNDALRDDQRVWLDRLERAGAPAEVWWVEPVALPEAAAPR